MQRNRCAVLVPVADRLEVDTQQALFELERRGYAVYRTRSCSQIDMARSQMATDFLARGFEETMWIDSDVGFFPDDVDKLRSYQLPICGALYPRKAQRSFAAKLLPGTGPVTFGAKGGLLEVQYTGTGFLHVRRDVYETIRAELKLPHCNRGNGNGVVPYFLSLLIQSGDESFYLSEDYSFCERARTAGLKIMVDTSIRLWHIGPYRFSWEEAALGVPRYDEMVIEFGDDGSCVADATLPQLTSGTVEVPTS